VNTPAASWDALSGAYRLRPGRRPGIDGGRPVLAPGRLQGLLRGKKGEEVGRTLTSVFALCAHAHRRTADLALAAAQGDPAGAVLPDPAMLLLETLRDHLRAIALDWPQRAAAPAPTRPDMGWLLECPIPLAGSLAPAAAGPAIAALRGWLEERILLEPAQRWLARHADPAELAPWCDVHTARLPPASCLAGWHPTAHAAVPETRWLEVLDDDPERQARQLRLLAHALVADPGFVQQPTWLGRCAENGPWARLRHRRGGTPPGGSIWSRLASRWLELVEIAAADPQDSGSGMPPLLASGALALGGGQALGWCEMARGLVIHWVRLDAQGAVADYRVLAPTEWNFHPAGALAQALARLDPQDADAARTLAAAYDPCVACAVVAPD
jgi:hypothetical protein